METQSIYTLRLCHIHKWDHFEGYGFNLHAEKGKPGQYVGKVDEGSPAEATGLKEGDRIIEVNGSNISQDNHKQVVQKIKALQSETKLLVVDAESDTYFKSQNITLHGELPGVITLITPLPEPSKNHFSTDSNDSAERQSQKYGKSHGNSDSELHQKGTMSYSASSENGKNHDLMLKDEKGPNSLRLNMTAKELRAQLASRQRYDPKTDSSIDLRKKYDIVQKL